MRDCTNMWNKIYAALFAQPVSLAVMLGLAVIGAEPAGASGSDWPFWRGPEQNGISREKGWNPAALADGIKVSWQVELGKGYSAVSIADDRLFTMGNIGNRDIVYCLAVKDGAEMWRYEYDCKPGSYPGPRATPVIDGERVYTLSREGHVFCFDFASGAVKWEKNIAREHGAGTLTWGLASSPVIEGELLLLNGGQHGIALEKTTGKLVWSGGPGTGNYSSAVVYEKKDGKGVAIFGKEHIYGLDLASGKVLWSHPWKTAHDVNAADPIVAGDKVFISSGYDRGAALLDISGASPEVVWQNKEMRNHFTTCILLNGYLYGIDGNAGRGSLRCVELETGKPAWSENLGFGGLVVADGRLIVLNEQGKLFIAEATPDGYREISRADTGLSPRCWTNPVLCRGHIFCRNSEGRLIAVDVRQ